MLTSTNTSMIAVFQYQYQKAGNYVVKLRVPLVDFEWNLTQIQING